ncbi:hypothetical protein GCM10018966_086610 [Streptomyces yanii]
MLAASAPARSGTRARSRWSSSRTSWTSASGTISQCVSEPAQQGDVGVGRDLGKRDTAGRGGGRGRRLPDRFDQSGGREPPKGDEDVECRAAQVLGDVGCRAHSVHQVEYAAPA